MTKTPPNIRGEVFRIGDTVAPYPDVPETVKDRGEIIGVDGDCGRFQVDVRWEGTTADSVHIDRISLVAAGIFS